MNGYLLADCSLVELCFVFIMVRNYIDISWNCTWYDGAWLRTLRRPVKSLYDIPHSHQNGCCQKPYRDHVTVGDKKIFEVADEVYPEQYGDQGCRKDSRQCFAMAEPNDIAYETAYDRTGHGDRAEYEEYQAGDTVLFDSGPVLLYRYLWTFKKTVKRFVGNDLKSVPALHKQRIEYQNHDRFDKEVEENQCNGIYLWRDTYGETGHSSKNDIGGRNA